VATGYDAKRDQWDAYDAAELKCVYDEYAAVEAARQNMREEEIDNQTTMDLAAVRKVAKASKSDVKEAHADFGSSEDEDADEDKYADVADAVGQKLDTKTRITVRNLCICEDTGKYLINLDPESAYYDPKTWSRCDAPLKNIPTEKVGIPIFFWMQSSNVNESYRRVLLATISSIILEKLLRFNNFSYLRGKRLHAGITFI